MAALQPAAMCIEREKLNNVSAGNSGGPEPCLRRRRSRVGTLLDIMTIQSIYQPVYRTAAQVPASRRRCSDCTPGPLRV